MAQTRRIRQIPQTPTTTMTTITTPTRSIRQPNTLTYHTSTGTSTIPTITIDSYIPLYNTSKHEAPSPTTQTPPTYLPTHPTTLLLPLTTMLPSPTLCIPATAGGLPGIPIRPAIPVSFNGGDQIPTRFPSRLKSPRDWFLGRKEGGTKESYAVLCYVLSSRVGLRGMLKGILLFCGRLCLFMCVCVCVCRSVHSFTHSFTGVVPFTPFIFFLPSSSNF